jgi:chromosome segregation ATPase
VSVIRERIHEILGKIDQLSIVQSELERADRSAQSLEYNVRDTLELLEKKNREISSLESLSLMRFVRSAFIDRQWHLEKKREEYLALSKEYDAYKTELSAIEFEIDILEKKLDDYEKLKKELEVQLENRMHELITENSSQGQALARVKEESSSLKEKNASLQTARTLSDKCFTNLTLLSAALRDVESWTNWKRRHKKNMAGNSKAIAIRKAKEYNVETRLRLNELSSILQKLVITHSSLEVNLISFENQFGMFFDNFLSDIVLNKQLQEGVANVEYVFRNLKNVKKLLEEKIRENEENLSRLSKVKDRILRE